MCVTCFQSNTFSKIGVLMAASIAQGGSGFPFIYKGVYEYLCGRDLGLVTVVPKAIRDYDVQEIVKEVIVMNIAYCFSMIKPEF